MDARQITNGQDDGVTGNFESNLSNSSSRPLLFWDDDDDDELRMKIKQHNERVKKLTLKVLKLSSLRRRSYSKNGKTKNFRKTSSIGSGGGEEFSVLRKILLINLKSIGILEQLCEENCALRKIIEKEYQATDDDHNKSKCKIDETLAAGATLFFKEPQLLGGIDWVQFLVAANHHRDSQLPSKAIVPVKNTCIERCEIDTFRKLVDVLFCENDPGVESKQLEINVGSISLNELFSNNNLFVTIKVDWSSGASSDALVDESPEAANQKLLETGLRSNAVESSSFEGFEAKELNIYDKVLETLNLPTWKRYSFQDNVQKSLVALELPEFNDNRSPFKFYCDITNEISNSSTELIRSQQIQGNSHLSLIEDENDEICSEEELIDNIFDRNSIDSLSVNSSGGFAKKNTNKPVTLKLTRKKPFTLKEIERKFLKKVKSMKKRSNSHLHDVAIGEDQFFSRDQESQVDLGATESVPQNDPKKIEDYCSKKSEQIKTKVKTLTKHPSMRLNNILNTKDSSQEFRKSLKCLQEIIELCNDAPPRDSLLISKVQNIRESKIKIPTTTNENNQIKKNDEKKIFFDNYIKDKSHIPEMKKKHRIIYESRHPQGFNLKFVSSSPKAQTVSFGKPPKLYLTDSFRY